MKQKIILDREGLQQALGLKGKFGKWITGILYRVLELEHLNTVHAQYSHLDGPDFSDAALKAMGLPERDWDTIRTVIGLSLPEKYRKLTGDADPGILR